MSSRDLTIGRLARETGVNVETVRYYQRVGLIIEPAKPMAGYRIYPPDTPIRIRFIKRAQRLGFTLKEIVELLDIGSSNCCDVRERAEVKRAQVEAQIRDLTALRTTLDGLIDACKNGSTSVGCPIVESLIQNDSEPD